MYEESIAVASAIEYETDADFICPIPQIVHERDLVVLKGRLGIEGR
jgi:hypothetical protein